MSNADGYIECFYLASPSSETIDLTVTEAIRMKLIETHAHRCSEPDLVQLMLAIIDPNTTIVYYKLNIGLVTLDTLREQRLASGTVTNRKN